MVELFQYQVDGSIFLSNKRYALLADEMGLGKTVQAIRGLERIRARTVIVICPSVARINWQREFEAWGEVKRVYFVPEKLTQMCPKGVEVLICSFDYATENYKWLGQIPWDCLIVDEAHFLKSHDAKRAKAIMGRDGIIRAAKRAWLLSGTPAPNHPGELWIMLYTFGVTKLTYNDFINRYCHVTETSYGLKVSAANEERIPELRQLLSEFMLRRQKRDVMTQLPPISYGHVIVQPGPVEVEILPSFTKYFLPVDRRDDLMAEIDRQEKLLTDMEANMKPHQGDKLTALTAMWDSVSTLRRYIGLQKVKATIELISKELEAGAYDKVVIFAIHRDVIETLRVGLDKFGAVTLYGGTDPDTRQKNIDKFQNKKKTRVFIGNILAAGTAITLTAASTVVFIEQDWVPGNNAQAVMRCHRIGQKNPVFVRFIVLDQSLDTKIAFIVKKKTEQLTQIFD